MSLEPRSTWHLRPWPEIFVHVSPWQHVAGHIDPSFSNHEQLSPATPLSNRNWLSRLIASRRQIVARARLTGNDKRRLMTWSNQEAWYCRLKGHDLPGYLIGLNGEHPGVWVYGAIFPLVISGHRWAWLVTDLHQAISTQICHGYPVSSPIRRQMDVCWLD